MARILILMTRSATLGLLDGVDHPSGFWAEEFVVPYEKFTEAGHSVELATIGGTPPTPDQSSLNPVTIGYTRPKGSPDHDVASAAHYKEVIDSLELLRKPMNLDELTREDLAGYDGIYISGGHGAMDDLPNDPHVTRVVSWILELEKPFAVVCHGQSALLNLRDGHSRWPLEGYRMTAFSHDEEMVTDMAGKLPFVLQVELERLGVKYEKSPDIWGSHVVEDRTLITGQNPYSSTALAERFLTKLS